MVALSSGDNGGRCASASLLMSHTLAQSVTWSPDLSQSSGGNTENRRAPQFGPIHITLAGWELGQHSNSSFKAGITESIFQRHKLDE